MNAKILYTAIVVIIGLSSFASSNSYNFDENLNTENSELFGDGKYGDDSVTCITNLSLYREYYKQWKSSGYKSESVNDAMRSWRKVYNACPKASQKMYQDGEKMLEYKFNNAPDDQKQAYVDTIEMIYLKRLENFPTKKGQSQKGDIYGRLGVDIMQKSPENAEKAYDYLKESVALEQGNSSVSNLVYYFRATIKKVKMGKADETLVVDTYDELSTLIDENIDASANDPKLLARWENARGNVEKTFEPYATCEALVGIYSKKMEETPEDIELLKKVTKILKKKKCTDSPLFFTATENLYALEPTPNAAMLMGKMLIVKENYTEAAKLMEEAVGMIEDTREQADILSDLAKIYYKLNQYPKARTYAFKALKLNPADGMSYVLIGDMYAASADQCGSNDLEKKTAYWAAVDKYYQAKKVDPELAELANKRIATWSKYFPQVDKIFFHDLVEGSSYKVECWINETTTVRAAK